VPVRPIRPVRPVRPTARRVGSGEWDLASGELAARRRAILPQEPLPLRVLARERMLLPGV